MRNVLHLLKGLAVFSVTLLTVLVTRELKMKRPNIDIVPDVTSMEYLMEKYGMLQQSD